MNDWKRISFLSRKELRAIQDRNLRNFISTHVYPFSAHYRKLFDKHSIKPRHIKSAQDLKLIPFTTKGDLLPTKDSPEKFLEFLIRPNNELIKKYWPLHKLIKLGFLRVILGKVGVKKMLNKEYRPLFLTATTGTTNQPVTFLYSGYDVENLRELGYRITDVFGAGEHDRCLNIFPYAPHLAFWQTFFAGLSSCIFMLSTGGGKVMGTEGDINAALKLKPNVLIGVPSYVYHLVRTAKETGRNLSSIKKVILGASKIPLGFKEKLASFLKEMGSSSVEVMGTYGFTEAKCAWVECPTPLEVSSGYHTYPDKEIFEVINPESGEVVQDGRDGELVYTAIDSRGSIVLRYRTGDLVKGGIMYKPCPYCKRTVPRISSDISRAFNVKHLNLSKIKGTLVDLNEFQEILESEKEIDEWQLEIRKKNNDPFEVDEIILYLSVNLGYDKEHLKNRLIACIHAKTEIRPNEIIIFSREQMLERVEMESSRKIKRFVDTRPMG
jgi:phenylacetate-coenzyme A ligase PaaK-like adenylate-forming protein